MLTTWFQGREETCETGTTTGDFHVDGMVTTEGTQAYDLTGTETTWLLGTD